MNRPDEHFSIARWLLGVLLILLGVFSAVTMARAAERSSDSTADRNLNQRHVAQLQKVVALCATEPGSARFQQAWRDWVRANPQADIDATIRSVISQAGTLDSLGAAGRDPARTTSRPSSADLAHYMQSVAASASRTTAVQRLPATGTQSSTPATDH